MLLRLHLTYVLRHRRLLSLSRPTRFTELVQRRKMIDRDRRLPHLIDKVAVKRFVAEVLGTSWVTPTYWYGDTLPDQPRWPLPYVVKSRHGCGQQRFVRDDDVDWHETRRATARWMRSDYGRWLDEWGYRGTPRGLLVEPMIGDGRTLPIDYKLFVFHGRVEAVQVHLEREHRHRWYLFDRSWRRLSRLGDATDVRAPASLAEMVAGAEALARGFDFVRIDFYDTPAGPRFGEMTFYPGSGLDPFDPPGLDEALGRIWLRAPALAESRNPRGDVEPV